MRKVQEKLPSVAALWALFWRAVVFFPLGVLLAALPLAIFAAGAALAGWAVAFVLAGEWWRAVACVCGLPLVVVVFRLYARWSAPVPGEGGGGGGYLV